MGIPTKQLANGTFHSGVSPRRSLFITLLLAGLAACVFAVYSFTSTAVGGGQPVMPLDDAYIHFQYAHQIAVGQPYVYNPGLPPTSGATSFLYPYLLALGDLLGFRGLNLGWWAMILGALALAASAWLVWRIVLLAAPPWLALLIAAAFTLDGWVGWHFMSGMETGIVVLLLLLSCYALLVRRLRLAVPAFTLLALIRPEGGVLAVIGVLFLLLEEMKGIPVKGRFGIPPRWLWRREWLLLLIPLAALLVQPLVNWLVTGSAVASGNSAKSLFGIIPPDAGIILTRILENFIRMWREFLTLHFYAFGMALIGGAALFLNRRYRFAALMLALWLLAGTAMISTLDTAFWHFKRYQMPLIALFFPLAGWGWAFVLTRLRRLLRRRSRSAEPARLAFVVAVFGVLVAVSIGSLLRNTLQFLSNAALNVGYVVAQPLAMARWLADNTPEAARIAVHDVGTLRYVGGRTTIDMVGLTTAGAAAYWRNGPGSVGEFLERQQPDLIASYGHGHGLGLGYLEDTDLYAERLASFTVTLDPLNNVALAAETQAVYRPDWTAMYRAGDMQVLGKVTPYFIGMDRVDALDVADIDAEAAYAYRWRADRPLGGFPSEYYQFDSIGCVSECSLMDGGRRINGEESFSLAARPGEPLILVTRLHAASPGTLDVYANDQFVGTRVIPELPGAWLEVPTLIPAALVESDILRVRVVPHLAGDYMPYYHWAYQGAYQPVLADDVQASFQSGAVALVSASLEVDQRALLVNLEWQTDGSAQGDAKIFIHVLDADGQIVAQADARPAAGVLPPGNWLPGRFSDTITIAVPVGSFRVVMGLYDPLTFERWQPAGAGVEGDNRLMLGEIEVR